MPSVSVHSGSPTRSPWVAFPLALAGLLAADPALAADIVERLAGRWVAASGDGFVRTLDLAPAASGFRFDIVLADGRRWAGSFFPTASSGVFVAEKAPGILDWFAGRRGHRAAYREPLDWARTQDGRTVVYHLEIQPTGKFSILRLELEPEAGGMAVRTIETRHGEPLLRRDERLRLTAAIVR